MLFIIRIMNLKERGITVGDLLIILIVTILTIIIIDKVKDNNKQANIYELIETKTNLKL